MPTVFTVDAHAGGEPCRVVIGGVNPLKGSDLEKQRSDFQSRFDWLRSGLMREPRGRGSSYVTGVHQWVFNDSDPLKLGFSLKEGIQ